MNQHEQPRTSLSLPEWEWHGPKTLPETLAKLLPELDMLQELPALAEARRAVLIALQEDTDNSSRARTTWVGYADIREQIVDNPEIVSQAIEPRARMQLAFMLYRLFIFREAKLTRRYIGELDTAATHASYEGFHEIAGLLQDELDAMIENALEFYPESLIATLKGELSDIHRDELRDKLESGADVTALLDVTHRLLVDEGSNPTEVFARLGHDSTA